MKASLQIVWPSGTFVKDPIELFAFDQGNYHQVARVTKNIKSNSHIAVADLGPVNETPTNRVILKTASRKAGNDSLKHEYDIYTGELAKLQGSVIPRCFGYFTGMVDGQPFGCLILEYVKPHLDKAISPDEFFPELMVGICKIHEAGIIHGALTVRHILQMGYSPRIIDFSLAEKHICKKAYASGKRGPSVNMDNVCAELSEAEKLHGDISGEGFRAQYERMMAMSNQNRMTLTGDSHPTYGGLPPARDPHRPNPWLVEQEQGRSRSRGRQPTWPATHDQHPPNPWIVQGQGQDNSHARGRTQTRPYPPLAATLPAYGHPAQHQAPAPFPGPPPVIPQNLGYIYGPPAIPPPVIPGLPMGQTIGYVTRRAYKSSRSRSRHSRRSRRSHSRSRSRHGHGRSKRRGVTDEEVNEVVETFEAYSIGDRPCQWMEAYEQESRISGESKDSDRPRRAYEPDNRPSGSMPYPSGFTAQARTDSSHSIPASNWNTSVYGNPFRTNSPTQSLRSGLSKKKSSQSMRSTRSVGSTRSFREHRLGAHVPPALDLPTDDGSAARLNIQVVQSTSSRSNGRSKSRSQAPSNGGGDNNGWGAAGGYQATDNGW